ncbi:MAG: PepSY domain-containing protein, partial [Blastopirellula sp. JB062]
WSAVGLNLKPVYKPPMKFLFGLQEHPYFALPKLAQPQPQPGMSWEQGLERGRELMRQAALQRNFEVDHERLLRYDKRLGMFRYQVKSTLDISSRYPDTTVWYDSTTGELAVFQAQTTQATGNTISIWINTLHFAAIGGWPYQTFVAILGLLITILSLSGVYVWWVKRRARRCHK